MSFTMLCSKKNGKTFWKCWRSKFECCNNVTQVDSSVDADVIVGKFAEYFANIYIHVITKENQNDLKKNI